MAEEKRKEETGGRGRGEGEGERKNSKEKQDRGEVIKINNKSILAKISPSLFKNLKQIQNYAKKLKLDPKQN